MTVLDTHRPSVASLDFLSLELTSRCQFTCPGQCYAEAGPTKGHGSMSTQDWHRLIDEAVALGTSTVQFIGGEPLLHPAFTELVAHALRVGLRVRVHSNLYKVRAEHWPLFEAPRVSLATSYYSDLAAEHDAITDRVGSHAATRAAIVKAVGLGVKLRVAIVDHGNGQRAQQARAEMEALGATATVDKVRALGRAAGGLLPSTSSLCGRCGDGKAAILPDGRVAPCEIGRFLAAGNVRETSLASVLASPEWTQARASVPARTSADPCGPDCGPSDDSSSGGGSCQPMG
ncbi:radical SAM protein [Streptomyces sp. NBC_00233]|uniref:radical SAM protein n=1 Tax=Streptomyces sp. NBC_00233 TaxID=2975686 RepID=UPI002256FE62|nr:radical SAM protein [Streptomyces sp. NBC_00233]MCX5231476.1 radical SAM protein [Streptomyces sp. NBC_00233]MCX5233150.1 radical SAM protein [Streptomyces sp. NBC_00233]MCX5233592.1 radical SAM protein [Streptomyces sp. NBC_00233]